MAGFGTGVASADLNQPKAPDNRLLGDFRDAIGALPVIGESAESVLNYIDPKLDAAKQKAAADAKKQLEEYSKTIPTFTPVGAPVVGDDGSYQKAVDNYNYQKSQLDRLTAQPRPTDPAGAAGYDAAIAAATKGVNTAKATMDAATTARADPSGGRTLTATGAGPVGVATYTAPQVNGVATYTPNQVNQVATYTPSYASAPGYVSAGNVTPQQVAAQMISQPGAIYADQIAAPGGVRAGTVTAERIGMDQVGTAGAGNISATLANRQLLDTGLSDQAREIYQRAIAMAESAANGNAPSAAEALMRKAIDEGVGAAHGLAASLQGRNPGVALREGELASGRLVAKSASDLAALRAQEIATARGQLGEFAGGLRAGDIQQSTAQLGADVEITKTNVDNLLKAAQSNQSKDLQSSIANLTARVDVLKANQRAALDAGMANAANDLQAQIESMKASVDVAKANAWNSLQARIQTTTNQIEVAKANQSAALKAGEINAANDLQAQISKMNADLEAAKSNQSMLTDLNKFNATQSNNAGQFNATQTNDIGKFNIGEQNDAGEFNAGATNDINKYNTGLTATADQFNAGETNTMGRYNTSQVNDLSKFNAAQNLSITQQNIDANLRQQAINNLREQGLRDDQIQIILAQMGFATDAANKDAAAAAAARAQIIGAGATAISAYAGAPTKPPTNYQPTIQYGPNNAPILD